MEDSEAVVDPHARGNFAGQQDQEEIDGKLLGTRLKKCKISLEHF